MQLAEIVDTVRPLVSQALIATDFDGTLAPLELDPQASRPVDGALTALTALTGRGARVAVITGRDAATVVRLGGLDAVPGLQVAGLYGVETWVDGVVHTPDEPPELGELRRRLPGAIRHGDPRLWIEDKRLSLVVHARRTDDPAAALAAVRTDVTGLAESLDLDVHPGSGVLEIRLPGYDKAGALRRLAGDQGAVLFLGDDLGDLPAFAAVRALRAEGRVAYGVAVRASGVAEVTEAADVSVERPEDAVALLRALTD